MVQTMTYFGGIISINNNNIIGVNYFRAEVSESFPGPSISTR